MSQSDVLIHTIQALDGCAAEYMLTGSLVSSIHGEPRATHDIDIVVTATPDTIVAFLSSFSDDDYYYDIAAAQDAVLRGGMFNIISLTGDKVDIWALTNSEFDQMRFSRKQVIELFGFSVFISSAEDTILMKLLWSQTCGGSEKQLFDAARIFDLQQTILDAGYLEAWVSKLNLHDQFAAMQRFL